MEDNIRPTQDDLNFTSEDLSLPRWKIGKQDGLLINTMTGEQKSQLIAIPIRADYSRFMWPDKFNSTNLPVCYSSNGFVPDVDNPPAERCTICPMAEWIDGKRPKCGKSYNYLLLDAETDILSVLNLSGARVPTARALNSFFRLNGVKFKLTFNTELERSAKGEFWQVHFKIADRNKEWWQYARLVQDNRGLLLTGGVNVELDNVTDSVIPVSIDPETGEVTE